MTTEFNYVWVFYTDDIDSSERILITIMATDYESAIQKIKDMKIPYLRSWSNIKDALKLQEVYETETDEEFSE
jgi:hypothetical protein